MTATRTASREVPEVAVGEVVVEVLGERADHLGRIRFVAFWRDGWVPGRDGEQLGTRGQHFTSRLDEFERDSVTRGLTVRITRDAREAAP